MQPRNSFATPELLAAFHQYDRLIAKITEINISFEELGRVLAIVLNQADLKKNETIVKILEKGADVTQFHPIDEKYCLDIALEKDDWESVNKIVFSAQFKFVNSSQASRALYKAIEHKQVLIVDKLLEVGAEIKLTDQLHSENPCLHLAAVNNDPKMIKVLFKYNVDPYTLNANKQTAIEVACDKKCADAAKQLIDCQAQMQHFDPKALHYHEALLMSIPRGQVDIIELLLKNQSSCTEKNALGNVALHKFISYEVEEETDEKIKKMAQLLLQYGANPEDVNEAGQTVFEVAKMKLRKNRYKALLEYSLSSHVPMLYQYDYLKKLLAEKNIVTQIIQQKVDLLNPMKTLPKSVMEIYTILEKINWANYKQEIENDFNRIFQLLKIANQTIWQLDAKAMIARTTRLEGIDNWYIEKWNEIQEIKKKCDAKKPPSYEKSLLQSTVHSEMKGMSDFLVSLETGVNANPATINQRLLKDLKDALQNKKENDPDSIRGVFYIVKGILSSTYREWLIGEEAVATKIWREQYLNLANVMQYPQNVVMLTNNNGHQYYTNAPQTLLFTAAPVATNNQTPIINTNVQSEPIYQEPIVNQHQFQKY